MIRPLSPSVGHFIAGFIEGEGHFGITEANGGQSFRCLMMLRVRDDDAELAGWLHDRTGIGTLRSVAAYGTSKPQVEWRVDTQAGCGALVDLLSRFPMRGRKRREFEIWSEAVEVWSSGLAYRTVLAARLRRELDAVRRFRVPGADAHVAAPATIETLQQYLHGFICAEGSLGLGCSRSVLTVHLRQDDRPLLQMFARALQIGDVRDQRAYPPAKPSSTWHVARLDDVIALTQWLEPEQLRGRKASELAIWRRAVAERRDARAAGRPAQTDDLLAEFRAARAYQPGRPPSLPPRSEIRSAETLKILRSWAAAERETLSCRRYSEIRRPGWPTRNTIARRFGSWDAALRAAGLADRAASTDAVRRARAVGGAGRREAHLQKQRERVLATLRYGINIHGSVPTAMQFFRWRLLGAPATPTQATVYRLFPGGWAAVLEALEESSAGLMSTVR